MSFHAFFSDRLKSFLLAIALLTVCVMFIPGKSLYAITPPEIRNKSDLKISQDMHGMDLKGREFVKVDLRGVDLSSADLRGAVFNNSQLQGADLQGADLEDVVAFASIFDDADLRETNFVNSLLMESTFSNSIIDGADFSNAVLNKAEQKRLCAGAKGTNTLTQVNTSESLGC